MKKSYLALLLSSSLWAAPPVKEVAEDWLLVCDNTHFCRLAGYQSAEDPNPVSVLLSRGAGDVPLTAELAIGRAAEGDGSLPSKVQMALNDVDQGEISLDANGRGKLSAEQTEALAQLLGKSSAPKISFSSGDRRWFLSPLGAAKRFAELEEKQKRWGKPSSYSNPGNDKLPLLEPAPTPVVGAVKLPKKDPTFWKYGEAGFDAFAKLLAKKLKSVQQRCHPLISDETAINEFRKFVIFPLDDNNLLVQTACEYGSYNMTSAFAVVDKDFSKIRQLEMIPSYGESDDQAFKNGVLRGWSVPSAKADCVYRIEMVWDGYKMAKTSELSAGLCRGFHNGAWQLPMFVSTVQPVDKPLASAQAEEERGGPAPGNLLRQRSSGQHSPAGADDLNPTQRLMQCLNPPPQS